MDFVLALLRLGGAFLVLTGLFFLGHALAKALKRIFKKTNRSYLGFIAVCSPFLIVLSIIGIINETKKSAIFALCGFVAIASVASVTNWQHTLYIIRGGEKKIVKQWYSVSYSDPPLIQVIMAIMLSGIVGAIIGLSIGGGIVLHRLFGLWSTIPLVALGIIFFFTLGEIGNP